jgi:hypothetical protein
VSFVGGERYLGEQAVSQLRTNMANSVTQIKRIIGRKFSEPGVRAEMETHLNFNIVQLENDEIGIRVSARARRPSARARARAHAVRATTRLLLSAAPAPPQFFAARRSCTTTRRRCLRRCRCWRC